MSLRVVTCTAVVLATACTLIVPTDDLAGRAAPDLTDGGDRDGAKDAPRDALAPLDGNEASPCPAREPGLLAHFRFDEQSPRCRASRAKTMTDLGDQDARSG